MRIAVILAGGKSERMGRDKALVRIGGERMIDRVVARLRPQADRLLISGPTDYGLGIEFVKDAEDAPQGPAGGVLSVARVLTAEQSDALGFAIAPVDAPFLPRDLLERLSGVRGCAVASDGARLHPTFAWWTLEALRRVGAAFRSGSPSLMRLAELLAAHAVVFPAEALVNLNTPVDLARAGQSNEASRP